MLAMDKNPRPRSGHQGKHRQNLTVFGTAQARHRDIDVIHTGAFGFQLLVRPNFLPHSKIDDFPDAQPLQLVNRGSVGFGPTKQMLVDLSKVQNAITRRHTARTRDTPRREAGYNEYNGRNSQLMHLRL
jgi:hypothetical protein